MSQQPPTLCDILILSFKNQLEIRSFFPDIQSLLTTIQSEKQLQNVFDQASLKYSDYVKSTISKSIKELQKNHLAVLIIQLYFLGILIRLVFRYSRRTLQVLLTDRVQFQADLKRRSSILHKYTEKVICKLDFPFYFLNQDITTPILEQGRYIFVERVIKADMIKKFIDYLTKLFHDNKLYQDKYTNGKDLLNHLNEIQIIKFTQAQENRDSDSCTDDDCDSEQETTYEDGGTQIHEDIQSSNVPIMQERSTKSLNQANKQKIEYEVVIKQEICYNGGKGDKKQQIQNKKTINQTFSKSYNGNLQQIKYDLMEGEPQNNISQILQIINEQPRFSNIQTQTTTITTQSITTQSKTKKKRNKKKGIIVQNNINNVESEGKPEQLKEIQVQKSKNQKIDVVKQEQLLKDPIQSVSSQKKKVDDEIREFQEKLDADTMNINDEEKLKPNISEDWIKKVQVLLHKKRKTLKPK